MRFLKPYTLFTIALLSSSMGQEAPDESLEEAAEALAAAADWYRSRVLVSSAPADRWRFARALYAAGRWDDIGPGPFSA